MKTGAAGVVVQILHNDGASPQRPETPDSWPQLRSVINKHQSAGNVHDATSAALEETLKGDEIALSPLYFVL